MSSVLDFFELDQFLPVVVLTVVLAFVGDKMAAGRQRVLAWARWAAATGLLIFSALLVDSLKPTTPSEFLVVVIRALMAAGMCWSASMILFAVTASLWEKVISPALHKQKTAMDRLSEVHRKRRSQIEADRATERGREEQLRRDRRNARALRRSQLQATIADQERLARIQEAREEVSRFYEDHYTDLQSPIPRSLFRIRLQNQLNPTVAADRVWTVAEGMIADLVTVIGRARDEKKATDAEESRVRSQISSIQQQINEIERQKTLFVQSPAADAEIVAHELRAFDHQIAALKDQIEALVRSKEPMQ